MDLEKIFDLNAASAAEVPVVTVGVTSYNCSNYIDQCMDSILNQSIKDIEIIIIDDNSSDGSIEKILNFERQLVNVKAVFHSQNSGGPDTGRQEILDASSGKYIIFVDSDDYFADTLALEKLINELQRQPEVDYVYCNMLVVDKYSKQTGLWRYRQYEDDELVHDTFQRGGSGVIPMKGMFRRDFFTRKDLHWHSNETAGDTLSALVYTKHGWKYRHLDMELLCYRQYEESFTFNLEKRIIAITKILDYIIENFSEEIYFSKIPWIQLQAATRHNIKMYLLGQFYYELLKVYFNQWTAWNSLQSRRREKLLKPLSPLRDKVYLYFSRCRTPHLFGSNIENILRDTDKMFSSCI